VERARDRLPALLADGDEIVRPNCCARRVVRCGPGAPLLLGVPDRVQDDMGDVVVGERVLDLAGLAAGGDDPRGAQHAEVLGDQGLAHAEGGDEFMDMLAAPGQLADYAQPDGRSQRAQELAGGLQGLYGSLRG
jgi:hypothetical protein